MASRSARRNRHRAPAAKARGPAPAQGMLTFSTSQVQALLAAGQGPAANTAQPMPRPPQWAQAPFPPGTPLVPGAINRVRPDTGRAEPRLYELPISDNLNIGSQPCVPWRILRQAADMPLFRKCIQRRKGICSLDFAVTVDPKAVAREAALSGEHAKNIEEKLRDKYAADIARVSDWLEVPDRENGYDWPAWTGQLMEQRLKYDATCVYPRMTYGGELLSLWVLDGSTIKPLLNEYGGRPQPPYPAYQQILYGFPRGEFTATVVEVTNPDGSKAKATPGFPSDQLTYERTVIRENTPYGMSDTEIALLDGILWMRRMGWLMAEYTEGVAGAMLETGSEVSWDVPQWQEWLRALNDHLGGVTEERLKWSLLPPGTKAVLSPEVAERYKPDMDMFLIKLIAGDFGLTATEIGFPEVGSLGASFHEGEEDVLNRVTRRPDAQTVGRLVTKLCCRYLGMPGVLQVQILGLESEDEAAQDAVAAARIARGVMTRNADRARIGEPSLDFEEADMLTVDTGRGIVFLEGASKVAPPGTLIEPAMLQLQPGQSNDTGLGQPGGATADGNARTKRAPVNGNGGAAKALAEARAFRAWAAKGPRPRPFECAALTKGLAALLAPDLVGDARIVFKAGDAGPKAMGLSEIGPAGRGTLIS